jgi:hypothetical protein
MRLYRSIHEPVDSVAFAPSSKYLLAINFCLLITVLPITVTARSEAQNVFARSNVGIVGSTPTKGMDACLAFILSLCCPVCR